MENFPCVNHEGEWKCSTFNFLVLVYFDYFRFSMLHGIIQKSSRHLDSILYAEENIILIADPERKSLEWKCVRRFIFFHLSVNTYSQF
jgi:hypothetical protein